MRVGVRPGEGNQSQTETWDGQAGPWMSARGSDLGQQDPCQGRALAEVETSTLTASLGQGLMALGWAEMGLLAHGQGQEVPGPGQVGTVTPGSVLRALTMSCFVISLSAGVTARFGLS